MASAMEYRAWGIGLGRTGTVSLCAAFRILGYKKATHNPVFNQLINIDAATDIGCAMYFKYLDKRFENSKFIYTVRDMASWIKSTEFILEGKQAKLTTNRFDLELLRRMTIYETFTFDKNKMVDAYERHEKDVYRYFKDKPENLLVMNITEGDGWDKLCKFLNLPEPAVPFPNMNSKEFVTSLRLKNIPKPPPKIHI